MLTLGGRTAGDIRVPEDSEYFLSRDYVDQFADEVRGTQKGPYVGEDDDESDGEPIAGDEAPTQEGDPTDGVVDADGIDGCIKHWKANASDDKKRMWAMFDEAGIFLSACRHHMILWGADMVRSGEL